MTDKVSIDTIKSLCAASFRVSLLDMDSARRDAMTVTARHSAIWLARKLTDYSLPQIGRHFGGRDHTTVLAAVMRMNDRIASDAPEASLVVELFMQLKLPDDFSVSTGIKEPA